MSGFAKWKCGNCGHEVPMTEQLTGLNFKWHDDVTSTLSCPGCGSYTIQRAYDNTFTAGNFLIVKTRLRRGKKCVR